MKKKLLACLSAAMLLCNVAQAKTMVAIDAGHGGKDPGAMSKKLKLQEKEITLSIAKELKILLDADPTFNAVMTRKNDLFIPVEKRSEIARKNKANYLVSIHADWSPRSVELRGASVWVLSNRRANDELGKWMEDHEKQSELLGGAGEVLSNTNEHYLNQVVLDLQFSHSQRSAYELGKTVLQHLNKTTPLAKSTPQHASLGVLRSPDIPSILVETGFLSNSTDEQKLNSIGYRRQIAKAIYLGLVEHRNANLPPEPKKEDNKKKNQKQDKTNKEATKKHKIEKGQTLYSIAKLYDTTPEKLRELNKLKDNKIYVGKMLVVK